MFKLTEDELQCAFDAIQHHGYSALLPTPKEWPVVVSHWSKVKADLAGIDLDEYQPCMPMRIYAPKSRINLRAVTLLHPQDLLIYTALTLVAKDDIERARIPKAKRIVFSYRSAKSQPCRIYESDGAYTRYRKRLLAKTTAPAHKFVAVTDIADFYPRIYQHRLKNAIESVATTPRVKELGRVLVDKFINNIAKLDSYGIPVGPLASRLLAEAVLIDVDAALLSNSIDFVRWVDDFAIFTHSEAEAQHAIFLLAEWLFDNHGLTLQPAKTRILTTDQYHKRISTDYEQRLTKRSEDLATLWKTLKETDDYNLTPELTVDELHQIQTINLKEMLEEAISDRDLVDYQLADFILGRVGARLPDDRKLPLVDVVLDSIEDLYPIADTIASFFLSFSSLSKARRARIAKALLDPIKSTKIKPPAYYSMWVLSIFADADSWNHGDTIRAIFDKSGSAVVRRYAALALANTGNRSHALSLKPAYDGSVDLVKTAILLASRKLGNDERKHWKRMLLLSNIEKLL